MKNVHHLILIFALIVSVAACKQKKGAPVLTVPVLSEADNKDIITRELSTWEFGKTKNFNGLEKVLADDYMAYFGKNMMTKTDIIKTFQNSLIRSYHLSNIKVKPVTDDVAIIYYLLDQDVMDINGDLWTPQVASASTYVRRNNTWQSVFYQETAILTQN